MKELEIVDEALVKNGKKLYNTITGERIIILFHNKEHKDYRLNLNDIWWARDFNGDITFVFDFKDYVPIEDYKFERLQKIY